MVTVYPAYIVRSDTTAPQGQLLETVLYWAARNAHDGVVGMLLKAAEIPGKNLVRVDTKFYDTG